MRLLALVAVAVSLAGCGVAETPRSDLREGRQEFRVELPLAAPGHAFAHVQRCFDRGPMVETLRRGNVWAGATVDDAPKQGNRTLHRCLLVVRDARVEVL